VNEAVVRGRDGDDASDGREAEHDRSLKPQGEHVDGAERKADEKREPRHDEEGDGVDGGPVAVPEGHTRTYGSVSKTHTGPEGFRVVRRLRSSMPTVRAEVVGEGVEAVNLDDGATYGDLLDALGFSPHEATVLVGESPVPEDRRIDAGSVRVLRLVKGGAPTVAAGVRVRRADADDYLDVMRVLDGAMLAVDGPTVRDRIDAGAVLVATADERGADDGDVRDAVHGALVRDGDRVAAVATRRRYRDRGVGTALVTAAGEDRGRLVAAFESGVRPFYESLGFDIEPIEGEDGRLRGRLEL